MPDDRLPLNTVARGRSCCCLGTLSTACADIPLDHAREYQLASREVLHAAGYALSIHLIK
jgi:hypothetical protein